MRAKQLEDELKENPSLASDPTVVALLRWATVFDHEIAAVQKVWEARELLPAEDLAAAKDIAERLLAVADQAQQRVYHTA